MVLKETYQNVKNDIEIFHINYFTSVKVLNIKFQQKYKNSVSYF